jgi:hypothetical protein
MTLKLWQWLLLMGFKWLVATLIVAGLIVFIDEPGVVWTCLIRVGMGHARGSQFVESAGWRRRKLSPDTKGYLRVTLPLLAHGHKPAPHGDQMKHHASATSCNCY